MRMIDAAPNYRSSGKTFNRRQLLSVRRMSMKHCRTGWKLKNHRSARKSWASLWENACIARNENMPICQDTGMAVVFVELGQDVHVTGGALNDAINAGVPRDTRKATCANQLWMIPCLCAKIQATIPRPLSM